jgi:predicted deacetylase
MDSVIIQKYIDSLTPKQYKAYLIAKDHLNDSFQIEKSNGFLEWVKKNYSSGSFSGS